MAVSLIILIVIGTVFLLIFLALVFFLAIWLGNGRSSQELAQEQIKNQTIDLAALKLTELAKGGPQVEIRGIGARLVVLVVAPLGRVHALPNAEGLRAVVESLTPRLGMALDFHQPIFRKWDPQVSAAGFVQSFFNNMYLAKRDLRGTEWSMVAGKAEFNSQPILIGMVFKSNEANSLGKIEVENPGDWDDILRVRS